MAGMKGSRRPSVEPKEVTVAHVTGLYALVGEAVRAIALVGVAVITYFSSRASACRLLCLLLHSGISGGTAHGTPTGIGLALEHH